jgi:hypothetical protein
LLIGTAVGRVENRSDDEQGMTSRVGPLDRVYENRQRLAVAAGEVEGDLLHGSLHAEKREELILVKDLAGNRQKILKPAHRDKLIARIPDPRKQSVVGAKDSAIHARDHVAA